MFGSSFQTLNSLPSKPNVGAYQMFQQSEPISRHLCSPLTRRTSPFLFASQVIISNDPVKVRLAVIGDRSGNLTHIALEFVRAHSLFTSGVLFGSAPLESF